MSICESVKIKRYGDQYKLKIGDDIKDLNKSDIVDASSRLMALLAADVYRYEQFRMSEHLSAVVTGRRFKFVVDDKEFYTTKEKVQYIVKWMLRIIEKSV